MREEVCAQGLTPARFGGTGEKWGLSAQPTPSRVQFQSRKETNSLFLQGKKAHNCQLPGHSRLIGDLPDHHCDSLETVKTTGACSGLYLMVCRVPRICVGTRSDEGQYGKTRHI
jgi:hypothetical protein